MPNAINVEQSICQFAEEVAHLNPWSRMALVRSAYGPIIEANLPQAAIGDICNVHIEQGDSFLAIVTSIRESKTYLSPFGNLNRVSRVTQIEWLRKGLEVTCSQALLGTVIDAFGNPLTRLTTSPQSTSSSAAPKTHLPQERRRLDADAPHPTERVAISQQLVTGIKAIDVFCPIGEGQRLALLAEAGVGKSTLITSLWRNISCDVKIIALVGERGREVNEWIEIIKSSEQVSRTILIVSTSDEPAAKRIAACKTATAIAEYFRNLGHSVALFIDSLTRHFRAERELALASGEPVARRGYPASVYSNAPRLLERAGKTTRGSITAVYTMLLSPDTDDDPMVEEVKSLVDGHISLSSHLSLRSVLPPISIDTSLSRLESSLLANETLKQSRMVRRLVSRLSNDKDLSILGGTPDAEMQTAMNLEASIEDFIRQDKNEFQALSKSLSGLNELYKKGTVEIK